MSITSYERVMHSINYIRLDRPPLFYSGTKEVTEKLIDYFDINSYEELLCELGVDFRYLYPRYIGPKEFIGNEYHTMAGKDIWGIIWKPIKTKFGKYYEIELNPLATANTLEEIEKYNWPNSDWFNVSNLKKEIEKINYNEQKAIVFLPAEFSQMVGRLEVLINF